MALIVKHEKKKMSISTFATCKLCKKVFIEIAAAALATVAIFPTFRFSSCLREDVLCTQPIPFN